MPDPTLALVSLGFLTIAGLTWFFSTRRRLFLRTFCNKDNIREAARALPRGSDYRRSMRLIAFLQFGLALVVGIVVAVLSADQ